jgi:hypothetical protein
VVGKPSWHDLNLEFSEPDVEWLKRANDAVEEMRLKPQADQVAKDGLQVSCDFCGKKHVLADCYNLCIYPLW